MHFTHYLMCVPLCNQFIDHTIADEGHNNQTSPDQRTTVNCTFHTLFDARGDHVPSCNQLWIIV